MEGLITLTGGFLSCWEFKVDQDNVTGHMDHNTSYATQHGRTVYIVSLNCYTFILSTSVKVVQSLNYTWVKSTCTLHILCSQPLPSPVSSPVYLNGIGCQTNTKIDKTKIRLMAKFQQIWRVYLLPSTCLYHRDTDLSSPYRYPTHCSGKHKNVELKKIVLSLIWVVNLVQYSRFRTPEQNSNGWYIFDQVTTYSKVVMVSVYNTQVGLEWFYVHRDGFE